MGVEEYITDGTAEYAITLFPKDFIGVCVDVGAYDSFQISNSWIFEKIGWDVYCIEPNPNCIPKLKEYRKNVLEYACGNENKDNVDLFVFKVTPNSEAAGTGLIDHRLDPILGYYHKSIFSHINKVKVRTLDWLMENEIKKDHIDYLSIDVERNEMNVLLGTNLERWKPRLIVIEHFDIDPEQVFYLKEKNYEYVHRISVNDFYIRNKV